MHFRVPFLMAKCIVGMRIEKQANGEWAKRTGEWNWEFAFVLDAKCVSFFAFLCFVFIYLLSTFLMTNYVFYSRALGVFMLK